MPAALWTDSNWDTLLADIAVGSVIPVIGTELLTIEQNGQTACLYELAAEQLASRLGLPARDPALAPRSLNAVLCGYLRQCQTEKREPDSESIYSRFCEVMERLAPPPPEPLRQLARVTHFNLFVTTTPDTLLEDALNLVRFGNIKAASTLTFTMKAPREDLRKPYQRRRYEASEGTDFSPLRKALQMTSINLSSPTTIWLEFFFALESLKSEELSNVFDALRKNHLLFLGGSFTDWLARFFLRATKRMRLSEKKDYDVLATAALAGTRSSAPF